MTDVPSLYEHQAATVRKLHSTPGLFDLSDPGTGKTRSHLQEFVEYRHAGGGPMLVFAPKSILQPSWAADIVRFFPGVTASIAYAHNRERAFATKADVYLTNHDAATWVDKHWPKLAALFVDGTLLIDESTAYKNAQAARSKAIRHIAANFERVRCLSGTPNPNTILELWHQVFLIDKGERLGKSFFHFRGLACSPVQTGPRPEHVEWTDKDGIQDAVYDLIQDISIRHKFEDCVDIPERSVSYLDIELPSKLRRSYDEMKEHRMLELADQNVLAPQASAVLTKLLQIASGSLYVGDESYETLDDGRAELVMDLVEAREQCLVAFLWKHQRDRLVAAARARGFSLGVIDGDANSAARNKIVQQYQDGKLKLILAHPQSASHGLTLTRGTTTIWTSPTWSTEHFEQFNRRQYRAGQTAKTEVIMVRAKATVEERVYAALERKQGAMDIFRSLMENAA